MEMIGGSEMEGFFFFWLFWIFWILSTFFINNKKIRVQVSILILLAIIFSVHNFLILDFSISITGLFFLFASYFLIARQSKGSISYLFVTSFILMLAYATFHLFELFDPVWLIFNRNIMLSLILAYLTILLQNDLYVRIITLVCGTIHGDILYSMILRRFSFPHDVGSFIFLDTIAITITILLVVSGFRKISAYFENHIKHLEREKQKQS